MRTVSGRTLPQVAGRYMAGRDDPSDNKHIWRGRDVNRSHVGITPHAGLAPLRAGAVHILDYLHMIYRSIGSAPDSHPN